MTGTVPIWLLKSFGLRADSRSSKYTKVLVCPKSGLGSRGASTFTALMGSDTLRNRRAQFFRTLTFN